MNRVPVVLSYIMALALLMAMTGLAGCQKGETEATPTAPEITANTIVPDNPSSDGISLGYFQFVFDDDGSVRVEEVDTFRGADINVGNKAQIVLEDFWWDEENRNWHLVATIRNVSIFTGYDVWAVFHSMGNKFLLNQDGFMWALPPVFPVPTRCPFIAYGKDQPDRVFPPMYQDTREIIIHQPEGIPKLAPIGFWIDATVHPRQTPGVEDLIVEPIDDTHYKLTGYIWDHQSPSEDLVAFADMSMFNGSPYVPLFDDGEHGDGAAGDNIWGCFFEGNPPEGPYRLTVYAFDPAQNQGENDVWFLHGGPCNEPVEPIPFETFDKGEHSGITYEHFGVINGPDLWEATWQEHTSWIMPPPPLPPVDFEHHTVIGVWIGDRPTNNHIATITDIYYDPCEDMVFVEYDYTPYIGCGPLDVITDPFHIVVLPKIDKEVYFIGTEVDCPPPPPECVEDMWFEQIKHGFHSGIHEPYAHKITNPDQFNMLWELHTSEMTPPPPKPSINFEEFDLIAVGIGDRPTTGFKVNIYKVCWLTNDHIGVFFKEWIPAPDCPVEPVVTQPFDWVLINKSQAPVMYFPSEQIYECGSGCEPVDFWMNAEGQHSCEPPNKFPIHGPDMLHDVWSGIHCNDPDMPPVPEIMWDFEVPFLIQLDGFSTGGYWISVDEACVDPFEEYVRIDWTLHIPAPNCPVPEIPTDPWVIYSIPWQPGIHDFDWDFVGHEVVYDCPPCEPVPFYELVDGGWSCGEAGTWGFQGFNDWFDLHWYKLNCYNPDSGDPPPQLPDIPDPIMGGEMKPFIIQVPMKLTSGYYLTIDEVCLEECTAHVDWTLHIPGETCDVIEDEFKPWIVGVAEFPPIDCEIQWEFHGHEEVYECNNDCIPTDFWKLAEGDESCADAGEYGWQYEDGYMAFWKKVHCWEEGQELPPLPVDPDPWGDNLIYHFGIQLPPRPTTGYYIEINEVCFEGCDIYIDYTEFIPGENCDVLQVETKPWMVGGVELPPVYCYWQWHFEKHEEVYDCPNGDCWDFEPVASGPWVPGDTLGSLIDNQLDWYVYWNEYHAGDPMPPINFDAGWGAYVVHIGTRPTTGFEVEVYEICPSDDPFGVAVRWIEWIPGETCDVIPEMTSPWTVVTMPLVDLPYFDEGIEEIYECD